MKSLILALAMSSCFTFADQGECQSDRKSENISDFRREHLPNFRFGIFDPKDYPTIQDKNHEILFLLWRVEKYLSAAQHMPYDLEMLLWCMWHDLGVCMQIAEMDH